MSHFDWKLRRPALLLQTGGKVKVNHSNSLSARSGSPSEETTGRAATAWSLASENVSSAFTKPATWRCLPLLGLPDVEDGWRPLSAQKTTTGLRFRLSLFSCHQGRKEGERERCWDYPRSSRGRAPESRSAFPRSMPPTPRNCLEREGAVEHGPQRAPPHPREREHPCSIRLPACLNGLCHLWTGADKLTFAFLIITLWVILTCLCNKQVPRNSERHTKSHFGQ